MAAVTSRIELENGTVYEARKPWPGLSQEGVPEAEQTKVALITYFPEQTETTYEGDGDDAEEVGSDTHPARYEIWGANDRLYSVIVGFVTGQEPPEAEAQYVAGLEQIKRRIVYARTVVSVDEEWSVPAALTQMSQRLNDIIQEQLAEREKLDKRRAEEEAKNNGQPQQAASTT